MFGIGPMELVLILVVALLVLGPKRMPELARTLGRGLSEFRRASNDLRQSLALDDLQNDLRDGLTGAGTIKKPMPEVDRPAQAGDDLPAGKTGTDAPDADAASESAPSSAGEGSGEENGESGAGHPGELPLDADPTVHHDIDPDAEPETARDAGGANEGVTDEGAANAAKDTQREEATRRAAMPADSPLGNVPVGGVDPTRDRAKNPEPKATTREPGGRDDRRG